MGENSFLRNHIISLKAKVLNSLKVMQLRETIQTAVLWLMSILSYSSKLSPIVNIINQLRYALIDKPHNKSQSQYKYPKHIELFTERKTQKPGKQLSGAFSTKQYTKQEQLVYKTFTKPFKLSNDYVLEPPALASNRFLESFFLVSHWIRKLSCQLLKSH